MSIAFVILAALIVDFILGDPRHFHPISGFGKLAICLEKSMNPESSYSSNSSIELRILGLIALLLLIVPIVIIISYISQFFITQSLHIFEVLILFFALGANSLRLHALWVLNALETSDLINARIKTSWIVSRDTTHLEESDLAIATIESVLENGNDAIFATLFWYVLAGIPGVVIYRLSNTLDAMWGYKSTRYLHFGWAAARLDDVLNLIPAHLTAISYAVMGKFSSAVNCWLKQAYNWKSLNAGVVMSTGAGALAVKLGGAAQYHGEELQREILGNGNQPQFNDIKRAINLVLRSLLLWLIIIFILNYFKII
ncbi:Adenosylcobinamide-phosphate synthase [hydrothermal vent metagenome]|uniref:Adenosylcobinamide-phosphate synthase n=1 Tax=hydrothermal vent metagenome TaxID=652676 RepID=A0A3B1B108_9ZZZZ